MGGLEYYLNMDKNPELQVILLFPRFKKRD